MDKNLPIDSEKFLSFSTVPGRLLISVFIIGTVSIVVTGLRHISPTPVGDEYFYLQFAQNISINGIYNEMAKGNPVGYTLILNLFSWFGFSILTAGRVLALISTIAVFTGLWFIGKKYFNLSLPYLILAFLTCLTGIVTSGNYIYVASDDMYYAAFFIWIAAYLWKASIAWDNWIPFAIAGALLSFTLLIRPLTLLIFPSTIVALLYSAYLSNRKISLKAISILSYIVSFGIIFLLQQSPSLIEKGKISIENKIPDSAGNRVNWVQKLELTNILKEKGEKLDDGKFVSWKQCNQYLDKYGNESLPSNVVARFFSTPFLCIKYCIIGVCKILFIMLRHTGIAFLFALVFAFIPSFFSYRKFSFFGVFCLSYLSLYVFNNMDHIEIRQLIIPMILLVFSGMAVLQDLHHKDSKLAGRLLLLQSGLLLVILILDLGFYFFRTTDWIYYC